MLRLPIFLSIILLASSFILNDDTDELNREQETEKDGVIVAAAPRKSEGACSDEQLRKLMHQGMSDSASESKKGVSTTVTEAVGGSWVVICAECNFSYLAHSTQFCVHSRYQITCLLYRDD